MTRTNKVLIVLGLAVVVTGVYLFANRKPDLSMGKPNLDKDGNIIDMTKDADGNTIEQKPYHESPSPTPGGGSTGDNFPLGVGSRGPNVKALQSALKITADGAFGNQTKAAVISAGYSVPVSKIDFDKIVSGKIAQPNNTPGTPLQGEVFIKSGIQSVTLRSVPNNNSTGTIVGNIDRTIASSKPIGYGSGSGSNGYSKVVVGVYYDKTGAKIINTAGKIVYIKTSTISNKK